MQTTSLAEYPGLREFLDRETAATIAVPVDGAGTIHIASLLYLHQLAPLRLYFVTSLSTEKCRLLKTQEAVRAACVVGTVKGVDFTLQMRGELRVRDYKTMPAVVDAYYAKRGNRDMDVLGEDDYALLEFVPEWARFTDYGKGYEQYQLSLQDGDEAMAQYDELKFFTDGGSRGNPGASASGIVILDMNDQVVEAFGVYLGTTTNNVAEWTAVKLALEAVAKYKPKRVHAFMDSELVCKQLNGQYRVKHPGLQPIHAEVVALAKQYDVTFAHVYREKNKLADAEVNKAIDAALAAGR